MTPLPETRMSEDATPGDPFTEAEIVTSLLSRQDEVIAELDLLEAHILEVIEEVNAQRQTENEDEEADVIQMQPAASDSSGDSINKKAA